MSEPTPDFAGALVFSGESRRAVEMAALIERHGGRPLVAPTMREVPLAENAAVFEFGERLLRGEVDVLLCLTGVGTRYLWEALTQRHSPEALREVLARVRLIARGPKPVKVLRELGLPVALAVPEPNTWREVLRALDDHADEIPLAGAKVAVQEYGESNPELLAGLRERGAEVFAVPVYRWALPEETAPLRDAVARLAAGEVEVALFTSSTQVEHLLQWAAMVGQRERVVAGLRGALVGSIGPIATETLRRHGIAVDVEPDHPRMGWLVRSAAERWQQVRSQIAAGRAVRAPLVRERARPSPAPAKPPWWDSPFMRACRREPTDVTPIWLMRQAGRYMKEYRALRAQVPFLDLCRSPELVAEVTVFAAQRLGVDAAILFADILLVAEPLGLTLCFGPGEGPIVRPPVRTGADVDRLRAADPAELGYVYEAVRATRAALDPRTPLIGFCGAPFTVASYLVEGGASRHFEHTKRLMWNDPGAWRALMERLVDLLAGYLRGQIEAGAQAVQLFDSWVGALSPHDYRTSVQPAMRQLIASLPPGVPVISFGTGTAALLEAMRDAGGDVIGLDWRVDLGEAWARVGYDRAVMGNLDPVALLAPLPEVRAQADRVLAQAAGRPGHIFNLGHGILPTTPVEHVRALVDWVHERTAR